MKYFTYFTVIIIVGTALALTQPLTPASVDSNVVALWHFDEGAGNVLTDASPYHNDGAIHNAEWVPGRYGSGLRFNGVTSFVDLYNSSSLRMQDEFTIEAWVSFDTLQFEPMTPPHKPSPVILGNLGPYPSGGGYQIDLTSDAELRFSYRSGGPEISRFSNRYPITSTNRFYHIASIYQRIDTLTVIKLYVDGILVDSSVFNEPIHYSYTNKFFLGTNRDGRPAGSWGVRELPGIIDEVRISNIARDPSEFNTPYMGVSPSVLSYGFVVVGQNSVKQFTLFNNSDIDTVTIESLTISNDKFTINSASGVIPPESQLSFDVTYTPTALGVDVGTIEIVFTDDEISQIDVSLYGKGLTDEIDTNVVALWHFDEGSGNILYDASIYGNDGEIYNGEWVEGKFGSALRFNGLSTMVELANSPSLQLENEFTIEAWVSLDELDFTPSPTNVTAPVILGNLGDYPYGGGYQLDLTEDAGLRFSYRSGGPEISNFSNTYPVATTNRFYNVVAVYKRIDSLTIIKLYVDGLMVDSSTFSEPVHYNSTDKFYLGTNRDGRAAGSWGIRELPGVLDEIKISKIARQPGEFLITSLTPVPSTLDFRFVKVGETSTKQVTLYNTSDSATITIDSIDVTNTAFSISGSTGAVAPHGEVTFDVTYSPSSVGADNGLVRFILSNADVNESDVQLLGKAYTDEIDTNVVALWNFDEGTGDVLHDASLFENDGVIHNATWVDGHSGSALHFDGVSSFVEVVNSASLKLENEFTIEAWVSFDSLQFEPMSPPHSPSPVLLGNLGPYPYGGGYQIDVTEDAELRFSYRSGGPEISRFSNTYPITSENRFYHVASIYQRVDSLTVVRLYVDGLLVDSSVFAEPLHYISTPTFYLGTNIDGRAAGSFGVRELPGKLDEIKISRIARDPSEFGLNGLLSSTTALEFGAVVLGDTVAEEITLTNTSYTNTLTVNVTGTSHPEINADQTGFELSPRSQQVVTITYIPTDVGGDTTTFTFTPTDTSVDPVTVTVTGEAHVLSEAPIVTVIEDIPEDQGREVRIIWFKSKYENPSEALQVEEYSVWRKVETMAPASIEGNHEGTIFNIGERRMALLNGELWDFITSIPAVNFEQYSYVAPTLYNSSASTIRWSTFRIAAHATTGQDFFSDPANGYSIDNLIPPPPQGVNTRIESGNITLRWNPVTETDVDAYNVYRSTRSDFNPQQTSRVGTTLSAEYTDTEVSMGKLYYYAITTIDASGNESRNAITSTGITLTELGNSVFNVQQRWNMVSVPRLADDLSTSSVFPGAVSNAFGYEQGYRTATSLTVGNGYWMKFNRSQIIDLDGYTVPTAEIAVSAGWNMIGSISSPVMVTSITSEPPTIVTSQFFGYESGYLPSPTIEPGKAYWVKVNQSGTLRLSSEASPGAFNSIKVIPISELPPTPPLSVEEEMPEVYALDQNYPNPFNPTTTLRYQIPVDGYVTLKIYNILGQEVRTLVDGLQDAGYKTIEFNASTLPTGIYFYRLQAGTFSSVKKMMLIK